MLCQNFKLTKLPSPHTHTRGGEWWLLATVHAYASTLRGEELERSEWLNEVKWITCARVKRLYTEKHTTRNNKCVGRKNDSLSLLDRSCRTLTQHLRRKHFEIRILKNTCGKPTRLFCLGQGEITQFVYCFLEHPRCESERGHIIHKTWKAGRLIRPKQTMCTVRS